MIFSQIKRAARKDLSIKLNSKEHVNMMMALAGAFDGSKLNFELAKLKHFVHYFLCSLKSANYKHFLQFPLYNSMRGQTFFAISSFTIA